MAMMMGELYKALVAAHITEDQARQAAEEVAGFDNRFAHIEADLLVVKWMLGTVVTLQIMTLGGFIGLLWKVFPR